MMVSSDETATIVVSGLLFISEVLSLLPVNTNGIFQTIIIGLRKGLSLSVPNTTASNTYINTNTTGTLTDVVVDQQQCVSELKECYDNNKEFFDKIIATLKSNDQTSIETLKQKIESQ